MEILEKVTQLFQDQQAVKTISTVSKEGEIHSIVAGSIMILDESTIAVAEIFMNTTSANLKNNEKAAFLSVKGMESYLINGTVQMRHTSGELFDTISSKFAEMNMPVKVLWTFTIDKIYNESASIDGGKLIFSK